MLTPLPAATPLKPGSAVSVQSCVLHSSTTPPPQKKEALGIEELNISPELHQTFPFFGVEPAILSEDGEELEGEAEGYLVSSHWAPEQSASLQQLSR